jgi:hypothetical protein
MFRVPGRAASASGMGLRGESRLIQCGMRSAECGIGEGGVPARVSGWLKQARGYALPTREVARRGLESGHIQADPCSSRLIKADQG